ncbi:hypothetical protein LTS10_010557 [Elasticomyces elasticus]|nr:hypothetical protein LTS10_010557 [Elasticomyces elasticus]
MTMAASSASTTELRDATTPAAITPPILTMPDELLVKTFEYLLTFSQPIQNLQSSAVGNPKLRAYNRIGLVPLKTTAPLFLNRRLHKVANDVLHSQNCITLSVSTSCAIHNQIPSNLAKNPYRHGQQKMTIELTQVHYTKSQHLAAALAKEGMSLHFTAVGEAEATLSSVKLRFVWSDVYEAFKIMADQKHEDILPVLLSDVPLKLQQISRKDPMTVQRLTCVLLKYYHRDDSVGRESKWVEAEHTEREYEQITQYAITGPDADVLWSEEY